jgi:hypothetical protein
MWRPHVEYKTRYSVDLVAASTNKVTASSGYPNLTPKPGKHIETVEMEALVRAGLGGLAY